MTDLKISFPTIRMNLIIFIYYLHIYLLEMVYLIHKQTPQWIYGSAQMANLVIPTMFHSIGSVDKKIDGSLT